MVLLEQVGIMAVNGDGVMNVANGGHNAAVKGVEESRVIHHGHISRQPPKIVSGKGNYLVTDTGIEIFDATCGAAVTCIGHGNERVKAAISKQLDQVEYCYLPFFTTDAAENLAKELCDSTNGVMTKAFIVSSGTEAVEAGLKVTRQYFVERGENKRINFISRKQSYHGNTLGSLSVGYHPGRRGIYVPLLSQNVSHVSACYPYRDMKDAETNEQYVSRLAQELEDEFQKLGPDTVCAFIAETVAGATLGVVPPAPGYFKAMKEVCERHGALFILDEVMAGMGRTGTLHAWEQEDVTPDLQTVAKGLGAGFYPIGAVLISQRVVKALTDGTGVFIHSQTYQAHPVACAAAYEVQQILKEGATQNAQIMGSFLGETLKARLGDHKNVGDIRGRGAFWALELVEDKASKRPFPSEKKVAALIHAAGLQSQNAISLMPTCGNIDGTNGDIIILSPAYTITKEDVETIVERLDRTLRQVLG